MVAVTRQRRSKYHVIVITDLKLVVKDGRCDTLTQRREEEGGSNVRDADPEWGREAEHKAPELENKQLAP
jgi:hypothetical protein